MLMEFRPNILIAWPKIDGEEINASESLILQRINVAKYRIERVLYVDSSNNELWAIDIEDTKAWPKFYTLNAVTACVSTNHARIIINYEPYPVITLTDEELGSEFAKQIKYRDEAWDLIKPLFEVEVRQLFVKSIRGALVAKIVRDTSRHHTKVCFQLRRFWQRGCVKNTLFPDWHQRGLTGEEEPSERKRGRPTIETSADGQPVGVNVTANDREIFKNGIAEYVTTGTASDLRAAWNRIIEKFYTTGAFITTESDEGTYFTPELLPHTQIPTFEQFRYYYHKWRDPAEEIIIQQGQDEYDRNVRPVLGDVFEEAPYPAALYQIDATIGDIYLVNDFQRERLIGRPVIYIVIDTFSRKIVGWSVTLEGPNWNGARLALEMAFEQEGYCEALIGDNGEIKSYNANSLVDPLNIRVANAPAYRPDWKPIVERAFLTIKGEYIDFVPGRVIQRRNVRGHDYRLEAVLSLNGFRKIFGKSVENYNSTHLCKKYPLSAHMIQNNVKAIPNDLWQYGINYLSGLPRAVESIEKMRLCLLPKSRASVHKGEGAGRGIYFKGLYYVCKRGLEEAWFERIEGRPRRSFAIAYEPLVDRIFLCLDHGRSFEECVLATSSKRFAGKDWFDVSDYLAWKKIADKHTEGETQQSTAAFHADIEHVIAQELAATATAIASANLSPTERLRNTRQFRRQLAAYERKYGSVPQVTRLDGTLTDIPQTQSPSGESPTAPVKMPDAYVPPASYADEIRAARQKVKQKQ
jgi:putative transposase